MGSSKALTSEERKQVQAHALRAGFDSDISVNNALIGFYSKCGSIDDVVDLFQRIPVRDVISWTGMDNGFAEFGLTESAAELFEQMPERTCVSHNALLAGFSSPY